MARKRQKIFCERYSSKQSCGTLDGANVRGDGRSSKVSTTEAGERSARLQGEHTGTLPPCVDGGAAA